LPPLPDSVQEGVIETIEHGFDCIIVYVDESGKPPAFYAAGWHKRDRKIPAYQSIVRYHKDINAVVARFTDTPDFNDYNNWSVSKIIYSRIVKII